MRGVVQHVAVGRGATNDRHVCAEHGAEPPQGRRLLVRVEGEVLPLIEWLPALPVARSVARSPMKGRLGGSS